jgi:hypothetical protein
MTSPLTRGRKVWRTKDGQEIPIHRLEDSHLHNIIVFLHRAAAQYQSQILRSPAPLFQGEMAQYYADMEWSHMCSSTPEEFAEELYPILVDLEEERALRKDPHYLKQKALAAKKSAADCGNSIYRLPNKA